MSSRGFLSTHNFAVDVARFRVWVFEAKQTRTVQLGYREEYLGLASTHFDCDITHLVGCVFQATQYLHHLYPGSEAALQRKLILTTL